MCSALVSPAFALRLYDLCEGPAEHVCLAAPYIAAASELVKCRLVATLVVPLRWQSLRGVAFKVSQHINLLEAQALLSYVRWLIRRRGVRF